MIIFNIYSETQASLHWVTDTSSSLILVHHHVILPRFPDSLVKVVPNGVHISLSPTSRSSCTIGFFLTKVVELCTIGFGVLFVSPPPFILAIFYLSYAVCYIKKKIKLKLETGFRFQSWMHTNHCWFWWIVLFKLSCFLILNK